MKDLFLYKIFLFDKRLFFLMVIFCGLTILCNIKGVEMTPFFIWAMYSEKEPATNKYEIYRVQVNDQLLDYTTGFTDNNKFFLTAPLSYFTKYKQNGFNDPTISFLRDKMGSAFAAIQPLPSKVFNSDIDPQRFVSWYRRYLQQSTGKTITKLDVDVITTHFTTGMQVQPDSSYTLIKWKQQ